MFVMCWLNVVIYKFSPAFIEPVKSELQPNDVVTSSLSEYLLQYCISDGVFTRIARCQDKNTIDTVAISKSFWVLEQHISFFIQHELLAISPI